MVKGDVIMANSRKAGAYKANYKNNNNLRNKSKKNNEELHYEKKPYLLPIILIITILPLIVKMHDYETPLYEYPWFPHESYTDFFLFYKQWFFVILSAIMVIVIVAKAYIKREFLRFSPIFIPLAGYAFLALLSSIFSKNRAISFGGNFEQFESIFVLLGYCLLVYYIYLFVKTEQDIKYILYWLLIGALVMSLIGISQYFGHDFFASTIGKKLITPAYYHDYLDELVFNFEKNRVYASLYNPNYVGTYVALLLPVIVTSVFFVKKRWHISLYILTIAGLIISLIGSRSTTGLIAIIVALIFALIFSWRYLLKYFYFTIPLLLLCIGLFQISLKTDGYISRQVNKITNIRKSEAALTNINTLDDSVLVTYKGNSFTVDFGVSDEGFLDFDIRDMDGNKLAQIADDVSGGLTIDDERFFGITFSPIMYENQLAFSIGIDKTDWTFTNNTEDGTYYYINRYGRLDKMITARSSIFTGYEGFASGRGYIWSRSIPLLLDNFIIGSGADTFVLAYPQQDYFNLKTYGYEEQILTKPHNQYLQIGVQTGTLSLILLLAFYMYYFITSIKLYIRGKFDSYSSKIGVAIFIGTIGYMITGIANDSSITVAPIFWVLVGLGIVVNEKTKQAIKNNITATKDNK